MKIGAIDLGVEPLLLAPMEDVTDVAFRIMCKQFGADLVYSEFLSADALIRQVAGTFELLGKHFLGGHGLLVKSELSSKHADPKVLPKRRSASNQSRPS